ncbi:MAG: NAD(P)-binding domain-containing protein [Herpetosiphonaceae bacterium]|nr:NAD(P)-binding domain-containing protein [Herpetosiphonaceae bacterium]
MRVAVIGAGVSGIAAAKCLLDEGLEPVVYEQGTTLGGVWRYDEALPDGGGPAYRGLHTNTSKQTTAFSDFPFPAHLPDFPPRSEMLRYLDDYADHFHVREHIRFATELVKVTPAGAGRWLVASRSPDGNNVESFDAVFVCSGVFRDPILPSLPGAETFTGTILHSRAYTVPAPFANQTVLVVGAGSSATDVALETSAVARHVYMSVRELPSSGAEQPQPPRQGGWQTWLARVISQQMRQRLARHALLVLARALHYRRRSAPDAPFAPNPTSFTPHPKLRDPLAAGTVTFKPAITKLNGNMVEFADGTQTQIDTIVCATGYALGFPFFDPSVLRPSQDGLDLYRLIVPPAWPTLACMGMFRVSGPAPPVAEMQARWAVAIVQGQVRLPSAQAMWRAIMNRRALLNKTGGHPLRLNAEAYQDMLAAEIGALPRLWCRPWLWHAILAGPPVAAQYRLDGPDHWPRAARVLKGEAIDIGPSTNEWAQGA